MKPDQISAKFAAHAIDRPMMSPIHAMYWGRFIYIQPPHMVQPQTAG